MIGGNRRPNLRGRTGVLRYRCGRGSKTIQHMSIEKQEESRGRKTDKKVEFDDNVRYRGENSERKLRNDPAVKQLNNQLQDLKRMVGNIKFQQNRQNSPPFNPNYRNNFREYNGNGQNYNQRQNNYQRNTNGNEQRSQYPRLPSNNTVPALMPPENNQDNTNVQRDTQGRPKCYNCQQFGHIAKFCAKAQRETTKPKEKINSEN